MQVPGRYDPETRRCVVDKPELVAETGHWIDADGDDTVSKAEFARWFWRRQGRSPNDAEWSAFQRADVDRNGTIDVKEFEAFLREKFGPKAVPRDEEQVKSLEDSLDEFSEVSELVASSFGWHVLALFMRTVLQVAHFEADCSRLPCRCTARSTYRRATSTRSRRRPPRR